MKLLFLKLHHHICDLEFIFPFDSWKRFYQYETGNIQISSFQSPSFRVSLLTCMGYRTIRRQTNSRSVKSRTGRLAD